MILFKQHILRAPDIQGDGGQLIDEEAAGVTDEVGGDEGGDIDLSNIFEDDSTPKKESPKADGTGLRSEIKPKAKTTEGEESKDELSREEDAEKSGEENKEETPEGTPKEGPEVKADSLPPKRDYSGFDESDVKILKRLDNRTFATVAPRLRELTEAKKKADEVAAQNAELQQQLEGRGIPKTWYEHPQAYTLSPEFQSLNENYRKIAAEESHYQQQLAAIENGEEWTAIKGYDSEGNPIYSAPIPPSAQARAQLISALSQAASVKANVQGKAEALRQNFRQTHEGSLQQIVSVTEQHFKNLVPELQPKKEHIELVKKNLGPMWGNHPLANPIGGMYSVIINQGQMIKELQKALQARAATANDRRIAGPGASVAKPAPSTKKVDEFDLDEILGHND